MNNSIEATNAKLKLCEDKIISLKNMILERDEKIANLEHHIHRVQTEVENVVQKAIVSVKADAKLLKDRVNSLEVRDNPYSFVCGYQRSWGEADTRVAYTRLLYSSSNLTGGRITVLDNYQYIANNVMKVSTFPAASSRRGTQALGPSPCPSALLRKINLTQE